MRVLVTGGAGFIGSHLQQAGCFKPYSPASTHLHLALIGEGVDVRVNICIE